MRKITLILSLLAIISCQELVLDNFTGGFSTGFQKEYQRPEWDSYLEFAVFGWFKINSSLPRDQYSTLFHFTSNQDSNFTDASSPGDRVLSLFNQNYNLHSATYTNGNTNVYSNIEMSDNDLDKWNFFYIATGNQKRIAYYNLAGSGVKYDILDSIQHYTSQYYKIYVGQSASFKYFPGDLYRVLIQAGPGAYREDNFNELYSFNPDTIPSCSTLYSGLEYTGKATSICPNEANYDLTKIRSIFIRAHSQPVSIYDPLNLPGKKVRFNMAVSNFSLDQLDKLVQLGAVSIIKTQCQSRRI